MLFMFTHVSAHFRLKSVLHLLNPEVISEHVGRTKRDWTGPEALAAVVLK